MEVLEIVLPVLAMIILGILCRKMETFRSEWCQ